MTEASVSFDGNLTDDAEPREQYGCGDCGLAPLGTSPAVISRAARPQSKEVPMPQDAHVPGGVVRVIELVGSSPNSFSDAVRNAVRLASQSLPNIRGVEVLSSNADVDDAGNLTLYKVQCKIAFLVEPAQVGQTPGWDLATNRPT